MMTQPRQRLATFLSTAVRSASTACVLLLTACVLLLTACGSLMPTTQVPLVVAPQWQAPLAHEGSTGALVTWWQRQGEPLLVELIGAAQEVNPNVSLALSRIESARAQQVAANAALLPSLTAQTGISRGVFLPGTNQTTRTQTGLQASWEVDVYGTNRALGNAARARLEGSQAQWHDARVSVAAEVANLYYSLSSCQRQLALTRQDLASRQETTRLTEISARAGFLASSVTAMARASAAESSNRLTQQAAQCDLYLKGLVALSAIAEPDLKKKLDSALMRPDKVAPVSMASLPIQVVSQRPDVFIAEREVVAASAEIGNAKARRLPRLSLDGSIAAVRLANEGISNDFTTWSFGPLALSLPVFDAGTRAAAVKSAQAGYQNAVVSYQSKVRLAVREVEEALVNLNSTSARAGDALLASRGYTESLASVQSRYGQGLASLLELEDARRSALASDSALISLQLERNLAWVALYRAAGGGFDPSAPSVAANQSP